MNYRHIYHAGNFADIIKHLTLIAIIEQLKKKEKPFAVLDSFAGIGQYDLLSTEALKTNESTNGIKKLLEYASSCNIKPVLVQKFLDIILLNKESIYPGSPWILHSILRPQDRIIACELHLEDYKSLKTLFANRANIDIHHLDAYLAIKAFLPFRENRGLIFIDPPFECKNEFNKLIEALKIIRLRSANICVLIWYPIKNDICVEKFYQNYQRIGFKEALRIDFMLLDSAKNMHHCGLLIINPPDINKEIFNTMQYLTNNIFLKKARYTISAI